MDSEDFKFPTGALVKYKDGFMIGVILSAYRPMHIYDDCPIINTYEIEWDDGSKGSAEEPNLQWATSTHSLRYSSKGLS